jgi:hypothetical protein
MPRLRRRVGTRLAFAQEEFLVSGELLTGVTLAETFGTFEEARAAWQRHGERLSETYRRSCFRLWGWWAFEAPPWKHLGPDQVWPSVRDRQNRDPNAFDFLDYVPRDEGFVLERLGLLDEDELRELHRLRALRVGVPSAFAELT